MVSFTSKQVLQGLRSSLVSRVLVLVGGFATQVLLARLLNEEELGILYLLMSWVAVLSVFAQHGWSQYLVREIPAAMVSGASVRPLLKHALLQVGLVGLCISILFILLGPFAIERSFGLTLPKSLFLVSGIYLFLVVLQMVAAGVFRGFHRIGASLLIGNAGAPGSAGYGVLACGIFFVALAGLLLFPGTVPLLWILLAMIPGPILGLGWATRALLHVLPRDSTCRPTQHVTWEVTLPFALLALLKVSSTHLETWLVGWLFSVEWVGLLGLGSRCGMLLFTPLIMVQTTCLSFFAEIHARNELPQYAPALQTLTFACMLFSILSVGVVLLIPSSWYQIVFGEVYGELSWVTSYRVFQFAALGLSGIAFPLLIMSRHTALATGLLAGWLILRTIAEVLAGGAWGIEGLLWAGILSEALYALSLVFMVRRTLGLWLLPRYHTNAFSGMTST